MKGACKLTQCQVYKQEVCDIRLLSERPKRSIEVSVFCIDSTCSVFVTNCYMTSYHIWLKSMAYYAPFELKLWMKGS